MPNDDRIVTIDSVTLIHPMYRPKFQTKYKIKSATADFTPDA